MISSVEDVTSSVEDEDLRQTAYDEHREDQIDPKTMKWITKIKGFTSDHVTNQYPMKFLTNFNNMVQI